MIVRPVIAVDPAWIDRLWAKIDVPLLDDGPNVTACWKWTGAHSQSGWRGVFYPSFSLPNGTRGGLRVRVNRLLILLFHARTIEQVPVESGEQWVAWLIRANVYHRHVEASHECDRAWCVNPDHLRWRIHAENVASQTHRRRRARAAAV